MNETLLRDELRRDEGEVLTVYSDSVGVPTIGVGRNLRDRGITKQESDILLNNDVQAVKALLNKYLPWWTGMSDVRQRVLANMAFNLGVGPSKEDPTGRLLTFTNTLAAMEKGDYALAAMGMGTSKWAKQVGARADRLIQMMREGR